MNNTEHWASQIIDELFGEKDTSKEQSVDISDEFEIDSLQAESVSFSKENHDILSRKTETRTLNDQSFFSSPGQCQFKSDILVSSSPLPDRLNYLNITYHQFSTKYLSCMVLDEPTHNQAHLRKKTMNSDRQDYINFSLLGGQMSDNNGMTEISEPMSSIPASQPGDSESENSKISILKTSENNYEFWSGDGLLSNETSATLLDDEIERKITKHRMEVIVDKFRKIGQLFEVCFVVPLASFIANNAEFLEFCLALLFCTIYAFIWPKKPKHKLGHSRTKILTFENLKDSDTKELAQTIPTSSAQWKDKCSLRSITEETEQEILDHAEIKTSTCSDSSLNILRDNCEIKEKAQGSWYQVTSMISSGNECVVDTASSLEFFENSIENLELGNLSYSSQDYTIDFVKDSLQDEVLDSTESSNTHDKTDLPKNSPVERKISLSSEVLEKALEAPLNIAPIICDDVKIVEKIKSIEKCDKDSLGHSKIEVVQQEIPKVESYKSEDESRDNDVCVGNTDYSGLGWSTDIKVDREENGLKESNVNENACNVNIDDSVTSLEEKSTGGMDQDYLADASLEVNFSMEGMDWHQHTNELPELDDQSIISIDCGQEKEIVVMPQGEILPFPDPSYKQSAHPDTTDSKSELLPTSYRPHITGKCRTMVNLNSNPSSIFEPILKRTSSFPSIFKECLEEDARFVKNSIGDRLREELEPVSWESFEVKGSPGKESKVTTPLSPVDSTSEEQAECLNLKKKKKGRMKRRLSFIFRNIREFPRHLSHSAKEKGSSGYQKHQDL